MGSFVERTYGMYDEFCGWWNFYLDSYEGGDDYLRANYLYRHVKEDESDFRDRIQRSYYYAKPMPSTGGATTAETTRGFCPMLTPAATA
jgi:hypothetical protein